MTQCGERQHQTRLEDPEVYFVDPQRRQGTEEDLNRAEESAHEHQADHSEKGDPDHDLFVSPLATSVEQVENAEHADVHDDLQDETGFDEGEARGDGARLGVRVEVRRCTL